jgi:hypothetical protein
LAPALVGWNETVREQDAPGANAIVHPLDAIPNWPASVPTRDAAGTPLGTPPLLVTVNDCAVLIVPDTVPGGKLNEPGTITSAAGASPTPARLAVALPPGEALTVRDPVFCPGLPGAKVTEIVQVAAGSSDLVLHASVEIENSVDPVIVVASAPVVVPPLLVTVKVVGALTVPC